MKKVISLLILFVMIIGVATVVRATTSAELADEIYKELKPYGMTEANRLRIERYLKQYPVTDEEADAVLAKVREVAKVGADAGVTRYSDLSASEKDEVRSLANETATILGLTLKFKTDSVEIYRDGKLIEVAKYDGSKLLYTGNNVNTVLVVSSVVVIALVAGFALRKKFANA